MNKSLPLLLPLLSDGQFHSGEIIAASLGVTRTAVWKQLQKLSALGLTVESVKGRGYRLLGGIELLSLASIRANLLPHNAKYISHIDVLMEASSTNNVAMTRVLEGKGQGYVCLAEYQSAGRGRRGRQWVSPLGRNLYLSLAWEFEGGVNQLEGLSLAVGAALADTLSDMGLVGLGLKWPNDILLNNRKLAGVLLEIVGDPAGICQVVVGVGININMPSSVSIDQPWASLSEQLCDVSRNVVAARFLNALVLLLSQYHQHGFAACLPQWRKLDVFAGKAVNVMFGDRVVEGVANGVLPTGALRLLVDGQEQIIHGGEVSLRLSDAP